MNCDLVPFFLEQNTKAQELHKGLYVIEMGHYVGLNVVYPIKFVRKRSIWCSMVQTEKLMGQYV